MSKKDWAQHLKQLGYTYAEIGLLFGVSRQRVQQILIGRNKELEIRGICCACATFGVVDRHHVSYKPEIVRLLCKACHRAIHNLKESV
jgi:transcriptional regulator with XRE-family HTH domain